MSIAVSSARLNAASALNAGQIKFLIEEAKDLSLPWLGNSISRLLIHLNRILNISTTDPDQQAQRKDAELENWNRQWLVLRELFAKTNIPVQKRPLITKKYFEPFESLSNCDASFITKNIGELSWFCASKIQGAPEDQVALTRALSQLQTLDLSEDRKRLFAKAIDASPSEDLPALIRGLYDFQLVLNDNPILADRLIKTLDLIIDNARESTEENEEQNPYDLVGTDWEASIPRDDDEAWRSSLDPEDVIEHHDSDLLDAQETRETPKKIPPAIVPLTAFAKAMTFIRCLENASDAEAPQSLIPNNNFAQVLKHAVAMRQVDLERLEAEPPPSIKNLTHILTNVMDMIERSSRTPKGLNTAFSTAIENFNPDDLHIDAKAIVYKVAELLLNQRKAA